MSAEKNTLAHLDAVARKARRAYHKNGPKSYRKGQGALLKVLHKDGGRATRDELIERLGFSRSELKHTVRKAERNGYVSLEDAEKGGYIVVITADGDALAEKRCAAQSKVAQQLLENLTPEEISQLDSLLTKIAEPPKKVHKRHCHGKKGSRHKGRRRS